MTTPRYPIYLSILAAVLTLGLKTAAYLLTGSVGLLSDALESGVNLVAALTALFSLWYASFPADPNHTYGHEKIEFFSSGLEGVLILVAAGGIAWYSVLRWLHPTELEALGVGLLVSLGASLINLAVGVVLLRMGRAHRSIVLEADGHHLLTDVWTSVAVLVGLSLVWLTGKPFFDPLVALLMSANIARTGFGLIRRSFNGLMDHSLPAAEQEELRRLIRAELPEGTDYHALRTRQAGTRRFADFHLLVPGKTSVQEAHDLAERIEQVVAGAMPGLELTIHIEPIEAPASWADSELLPVERAASKSDEG
jgi:cation diffusion facilitator family transporter